MKYKFAPQFYGALRWNQQLFATIRDEDEREPWGEDVWRIDAALGYRFTDYLQAKVQIQPESSRRLAQRSGASLRHAADLQIFSALAE